MVNPISRPIDYLDVGDYLSDGYSWRIWSLVNPINYPYGYSKDGQPYSQARPIDYLDVGDYLSDGYQFKIWSLANPKNHKAMVNGNWSSL